MTIEELRKIHAVEVKELKGDRKKWQRGCKEAEAERDKFRAQRDALTTERDELAKMYDEAAADNNKLEAQLEAQGRPCGVCYTKNCLDDCDFDCACHATPAQPVGNALGALREWVAIALDRLESDYGEPPSEANEGYTVPEALIDTGKRLLERIPAPVSTKENPDA